jgi:hypothetical protein
MVSRARAEPGSKKNVRTGVAISPTELCAADIRLRGASAWRVPLESPNGDGTSWPALTSALAELARTVGVTEGTLAVSLMPPLTEMRRLELPPLRDDDLQRLLSRNASKYFVSARTPQLVGATRAGRRVRGAPSPVVAASASARLISVIRAAAQQAGWDVVGIAPAESAWAAAAIALWPSFAKQNAYALIANEDRTDLLQIEHGSLVNVRRFRAGAADAAMIVDTIGPSARIGVAGAPQMRRELSAALTSLGVTPTPPTGDLATAAERGDLLAAHFAGSEIGPVLRTEDAVSYERNRARKATWMIAAATAALLLVTAGIELWGVHHQLDLIRAERTRIRPQIATTLIGRTTVDAAYQHLATLNTVERASPQWSAVIADLTESVPEDAHLLAIRAREDSLIIDGLADHAARVFDAVEKAPALIEVKAAAPVRRELQQEGGALEHFTIAARVRRPSNGPITTSALNGSTPRGGGRAP